MSYQAKRELLHQVAPRYREASECEKTRILDELTAATGYARKYAIRLLNQPGLKVPKAIKRGRERRYGKDVQVALVVAWSAANCICGKRLVPFLPELVKSLEEHGHLALTDEVRNQLLAMSAATADRILADLRPDKQRRGATTTKAGSLLKHQIPIRTFTDWNETQPGFFEVDAVAHCGSSVEGMFLWSLVFTDVATGWTECLALRHRSQDAVIDALERVQQLLPVKLLGFDTDNGAEFLNYEVLAYCEQKEITFTRGRPYKKNDQCFVEQKNGSIVRQIVGYDRFDGEVAYRQLSELYRAVRLYVNYFQPSMKLVSKHRNGSKVQRQYDAAQTPFQRLTGFEILSAQQAQHLSQLFSALDPVRLLQQIQTLQDALWRHAVVESSMPDASDSTHVRFDLTDCLPVGDLLSGKEEILSPQAIETTTESHKRKYRRTAKSLAPRTYRTRKDPFEEVNNELHQWLLDAPDRTAKSLLAELQQRYPEQYSDYLLRTLQRRVQGWRSRMIIEFDTQLVYQDATLNHAVPSPLRATDATGV